jgi:hypothetical protein
MQTSYERKDHRGRHRYRSHLCARQHGRDHRVLVGRVGDRMVHWSAAPAPPRTEKRRINRVRGVRRGFFSGARLAQALRRAYGYFFTTNVTGQ